MLVEGDSVLSHEEDGAAGVDNAMSPWNERGVGHHGNHSKSEAVRRQQGRRIHFLLGGAIQFRKGRGVVCRCRSWRMGPAERVLALLALARALRRAIGSPTRR
eukprot:5170016-Heterocapsa_arctica.AAC.1